MSPRIPLLLGCAIASVFAGLGLYLLQARPSGETAARAQAEASQPKGLAEGDASPADLELRDLDGKAHRLADYRGKLLIVNFWATWCGPCLHEIPSLVKVQADYAARGVQLLGPAVDEADDVRQQAPALKFNYPVLVGESEAMLDLLSRFGNVQGGLPYSVVIGPDGRILERQLGEFSGPELAALIDRHLPK